MFGLGTPEVIVILLIAFLIFGSKKLPEIGAGLGKAIGSFKKGLGDIEEAGVSLKNDLPGVQEVAAVKGQIDKVRDLAGIVGK